jgi:hypothetical protein
MGKKISNIVFTKNRPLQLDAYLESFYRYFPKELIQTYILYKPELFDEQYQQVFNRYADCIVIREKDFSSDYLGILKRIDTKYVLFGVDDVVYFDKVDFELINQTFDRCTGDIFGFSLRFSKQSIKKCGDTISETEISGQAVYSINWTQGRTPTTRYPFELGATIYTTDIVKKVIYGSRKNNPLLQKLFAPASPIIRTITKIAPPRKFLKSLGYFFSPNTLESWNCRWCQNDSGNLPNYLYFQKLCAAAIQVNMVNTTTKDSFDGSQDYTVETLNEKYKQGYRLDIDSIANNKPAGTHCEQKYFKLTKI